MYLGITSIDGVAHFAHLGGFLVGLIILFFWKLQGNQQRQSDNYRYSAGSSDSHYDKDEGMWSKMKKGFGGKREPKMRVTNVREANYVDHQYNEQKRQNNEEIDRILDKIRKNGYQNLSDSEKAVLFNASKSMRGEE
jgi:hypothetical protein